VDHAAQSECEGDDVEKFRSGWLHLSIDTGSYLMAPFFDIILINTHIAHPPYDHTLYDSAKVQEATTGPDRTAIVKIL
jgi:hypothetical protein